jgi:hypothetical protein
VGEINKGYLMDIKELMNHLTEMKSKIEDKDVLKKLDLIIDGGKSVEKTFNDQFTELKDVKESVKSIKGIFQLDETTPFKEISAKVKEKYDSVMQEKDSIGQSADDQTKTLATMKTTLENLQTEFTRSQDEIKVGKEQLADKELSENIRNAYKGDTDLYTFAESKIKDIVRTNPDSKVDELVSKFLEDNVKFQLPEQNAGAGGDNPKPIPNANNAGTLLDVMNSVGTENKG